MCFGSLNRDFNIKSLSLTFPSYFPNCTKDSYTPPTDIYEGLILLLPNIDSYLKICNLCVLILILLFFPAFLSTNFYFMKIQLIYNSMLLSGVQQQDSIIHINFSDSFPLWVIIRHQAQLSVLDSRSLLAICFIHSRVYVLIPDSQLVLPLRQPQRLVSVCGSLLFCK